MILTTVHDLRVHRTPSVYRYRKLLKYLTVSSVLLAVTGCASTGGSSVSPSPSTLTPAEQARLSRLDRAADPWMGTPYALGGTTRRGIDCSAFVTKMYIDVFDRQLPRTTEAQAETGHKIDRTDLKPGDLIFFRPSGNRNHVGIYLAGQQFVHASTSEGVTISSLRSVYWSDAYWMARRTTDSIPADASPHAKTSEISSPDSPRSKTGW